jgi:hypothetical protein
MAKIQIKNSFITSSAQITISSSLVRFSDSIRAKGITGSFSGSFAGSNLFVQGGNSFGTTALLGTNDNQPFALETNGSEKLRITTAGNVGIGTSSPAAFLDIVGNGIHTILRSTSATSYTSLRLYNDQNSSVRALEIDYSGASYSGALITSGPTGESACVTTTGAYPLAFGTNNTARMTILSGGNVGIATSSPTAKLQVGTQMYGSAPDANYFVVGNENFTGPGPVGGISGYPATANRNQVTASMFDVVGGWERINGSHALLRVSAYDVINSAPALTVLNNGNVGMGTTSPAGKFEIKSAAQNYTTSPAITFTDNSGVSDSRWILGNIATTYGAFNLAEAANASSTTYTPRITILPGGNVGIGSTAPAYKLDVNGSIAVSGYRFADFNTYYNRIFEPAGNTAIYIGNASDPSNYYDNTTHYFRSRGGVSNYVFINSGGNLGIGTTSVSSKLQIGNGTNNTYSSVAQLSGDSGGASTLIALSLVNSRTAALSNGVGIDFHNASAYSATGRISVVQAGPVTTDSEMRFFVYNDNITQRMVLNYLGNLGIGTSSPLTKLDIANTQASGITMRFDTSTSYQAWIRPYWNSNTDSRVDFAINRAGGSTPDVIMSVGYGGNVGIGVTDPAARLTISGSGTGRILMGNAGFSTSGNYSGISLNGTLNTTAYNILSSPSDTSLYINRPSGASMFFRMANNDQMKLDSGGNLGIGTTSPSQVLHVVGNVKLNSVFGEASTTGVTAFTHTTDSTQPSMYLWGKDHATYPGQVHIIARSDNASADAGKIAFYDYNGSGWDLNMVINKGGNIGIGTSSPASILHLNGTAPTILTLSSTSYPSTYLSTFGVDSGARGFLIFGNNGENQIRAGRTTTGGYLDFYTNNTVGQTTLASDGNFVMRLSAGGLVGIGTITPTAKLDVANGGLSVSGWSNNNSGTTGGVEIGWDGNWGIFQVYDRVNANYEPILINGSYTMFYVSGTERARLNTSGNLGIGTSNPVDKLDINGNLYFSKASDPRIYAGTGIGLNIDGQALWLNRNTNASIIMVTGGGNIGIGTNSPNDKLTILADNYLSFQTSNVTFNSGRGARIGATSTGSGIGELIFETYKGGSGGGERMRITSDGCVGIGSSSPAAKLDIVGTNTTIALSFGTTVPNNPLFINTYGGAQGIGMDSADAGIRLAGDYAGGGNRLVDIGYYSSGTIAHANWVSRLRVLNNGNVGIGTTLPLGKLHVTGSASVPAALLMGNVGIGTTSFVYAAANRGLLEIYGSTDSLISLRNSNNPFYIQKYLADVYINNTDNGAVILNTNNIERARITSGGNVGIGTTVPTSQLQLSGSLQIGNGTNFGNKFTLYDNFTDGKIAIALRQSTGASVGDDIFSLYCNSTTGEARLLADDDNGVGFMTFYMNASERMRITNNGNIGIGTTAPAAKLDVSGGSLSSVSGSRFTIASFTNNNGNASYLNIETARFSTGTDWTTARTRIQQTTDVTRQAYIDFNPNGELYGLAFGTGAGGSGVNERMRILSNGNVGIGTTAPAAKLEITGGLIAGGVDNGSVIFYRSTNPGTIGTTDAVLLVSDRSNSDWGIMVDKASNDYGLRIQTSNAATNALAIYDGSTYNARIYGSGGGYLSGNVGIGTSTLESGCVLTVKASNSTRLSITDGTTRAHLWPTGGNFYFSTETASDIVIITNATERMRITSAGNVGIGTTSPGSKLDVNGTFRTAINNLTIFNDYIYVSPTENNTLNSAYFANSIADMWINYRGYNNGNTQFRNFNVGNGKTENIAWFDGTNKRLSINNGQTANYTLDVNGTFNATGTSTLAGVSITGTINSSTTEVVRINNNNGYISFYNTAGTTRTGYLQGNTGNAMLLASENNSIIQFSVGGSEVARISTSGNVGIGTTSPSTKFSIIGTMSSVSINAQRQYTYSAIGSTNDDIWFRSSTSFANNGAAASLNLARLTYQSAGTGNDLTDKVGIWLRGFYDNSAGGLPIYLGGYAYSSQIPAVTITALNADGMGGNLGIGTTAPLSKLNSYGSGSNLSLFRVDGGNGTLFEVTDQLSGSLFSVNDVSGLPLLEVFSNNRVVAGKYGSNALVVSGSSVGIGTSRPAYKLQVSGSFAATTKSFVIKHPDPAKSDKQLIHGVTEGPEHSVFVRGKLLNDNIIQLPDYWQHLVHEESITVTLTPNKYYQQLYVKNVTDTTIEVGTETDKLINCYYYVVGERKDIPKLITEI